MKQLIDNLDKLTRALLRKAAGKKWRPIAEAADHIAWGTDDTTVGAPHILDGMDIKRTMGAVILALVPAAVAAIYLYGLRIVAIIAVSYIFGGATEVIFAIVRKKSIHEGFLVTGLLFPLVLPPSIPLWIVAVGIVFGTMFGKEMFGGTGRNIFNPALVGRVFLSMAFPACFSGAWVQPFTQGLGGLVRWAPSLDTVTSATPLITFKAERLLAGYDSLLLGGAPGSIGETFRIGLIVGGLFLIVIRVSDWRIPLAYLGSVAGLAYIVGPASPRFAPPVFQLLSGGLMLGAFFMATDPVTAPLTSAGRWVYGVLLGVCTLLIRTFSGFPDGVMFSILLMNGFAPFIDAVVIRIRFKAEPVLAASTRQGDG